MQAIQNLVLPSLDICSEEELYFRLLNTEAMYSFEQKKILLDKGGKVSFNTYFNFFSISSWKKNCDINDLYLKIRGAGRFQIRIMHSHLAKSQIVLHERELSIQDTKNISINVEKWKELTDGLLYVVITALSEAEIHEISWQTETKVRQNVNLGIVITHFNRKSYVVPAIKRITQFIENSDMNVQLIVVDNSQNITEEEGAGAKVISNKNLGGSGGFMRGLLYLKDNGFSHCLFMDDDASCEMDSIARAYYMMSFAKENNLAIAGGLMDEAEPYILTEKGAQYDGACIPLKVGFDMRDEELIHWAEYENNSIDYGGWWFFCYRIDWMQSFAFPYFIRGDDIMFSMVNKFQTASPIGICCWGADFGLKAGPFPNYFEVRSHIVQMLTNLNSNLKDIVWKLAKQFFRPNFSSHYETSESVIKAISDTMKGPDFWIENIDTKKVRADISKIVKVEKMKPLDVSEINPDIFVAKKYDDEDEPVEPIIRKLIRRLMLQGVILPRFMFKNRIILQKKGFKIRFAQVYLYKHILHYDPTTNTGFITTHNNKRFWCLSFKFFLTMLKFIFISSSLRKQYKSQISFMTSESFWREQLNISDLRNDE